MIWEGGMYSIGLNWNRKIYHPGNNITTMTAFQRFSTDAMLQIELLVGPDINAERSRPGHS
jgi:hypothetical protein